MEPLEDLEWRECRSAKHGSPFWKNLKISGPAEVKEAKATADCLASASLYCKAMKAMVQTLVPETVLLQLDDEWSFFSLWNGLFAKKIIFHWLVKVMPVQHAWQFKQAIPTTGVISAASNRCPHFTSATAIKHHKSVWPSKRANSCTLTIVCKRDCSRIKQNSCLENLATFNAVAEGHASYGQLASSRVKWFNNSAERGTGQFSHLKVF